MLVGISGIMSLLPLHIFAQISLEQSDNSSIFREARDLMDSKNHESARKLFTEYRRENPESSLASDAMYYEAYCALVLYHRDGEKLIQDFLGVDSSTLVFAT